jgi:hypothetical protein
MTETSPATGEGTGELRRDLGLRWPKAGYFRTRALAQTAQS